MKMKGENNEKRGMYNLASWFGVLRNEDYSLIALISLGMLPFVYGMNSIII